MQASASSEFIADYYFERLDFQQLVRDDVAVGQGDINAVADLAANQSRADGPRR